MKFDLSKYEIVETGNWQNPPPITLMDDLNGFFKMFESVSDKKLLKWNISNPIDHRTIVVDKGHYIGFFAHGKLFGHFMKDFDSIEDYLEAKPKEIRTPEELTKDREARENNWPDYKTAKEVWNYISKSSLVKQERFEHKRKELFKQIDEKNPHKPHYHLMPPFDEDCYDNLSWKLWFYAHLNGWKSFKELLSFAKKVYLDYEEKTKDDHYRYLYLSFLVLYGPFEEEKNWLQGWPSFDSLLDFWNAKESGLGRHNRLQKATWPNHREQMDIIQKEIYPTFKFPSFPTYDPDCQNRFDWVIWTIAQKNGWSSYKQLLKIRDSKDPKITEKISDKLLYEFAIRTKKEVEKIKVMAEQQKKKLFFEIDGKLMEINLGSGYY